VGKNTQRRQHEIRYVTLGIRALSDWYKILRQVLAEIYLIRENSKDNTG
jgi:hypothetical protein